MPSEETLRRALVGHVPDAFLAYGADTDIDAALDEAKSTAWDEYGHAQLVPTIADTDTEPQVVGSAPVPLAQAVRRAQDHLGKDTTPGVVYALAVAPDSAWKRRKVTLRFDDITAPVPETPGDVDLVGPDLEGYVDTLLAEAGGRQDGETLEGVVVKSVRSRFKPVVTAHKGGSENTFVVRDARTHALVSEGHKTAGDARKSAVETLRAGGVGGDEEAVLEVVKVVGRAEGLPLLQVERTRQSRKGSLQVVLASEKDATKTKQVGWLLYGVVGDTPGDVVSE